MDPSLSKSSQGGRGKRTGRVLLPSLPIKLSVRLLKKERGKKGDRVSPPHSEKETKGGGEKVIGNEYSVGWMARKEGNGLRWLNQRGKKKKGRGTATQSVPQTPDCKSP